MLKKSDLMYELPEKLIAQRPPKKRGTCRLMIVNRLNGNINHGSFADISGFLNKNDALVLNDTRVIRARLIGRRQGSGGAVELLLLEKVNGLGWRVMIRPGSRCRRGNRFCFAGGLTAEVEEELGQGRALVEFSSPGNTEELLKKSGTMPIPPYIKRQADLSDEIRYQTVFGKKDGAVAAPTAGLHFTEEILSDIVSKGTGVHYITLHVGPGTFQPLRNEILAENRMEEERYMVPGPVARTLLEAREKQGRIVAVGTTVTRALESVDIHHQADQAGRTSLFIHPPYSFRNVDVLLTNFHLPGSSLISLVGSFAGMDLIMEAYSRAVEQNYRFYSYGDAMLII